MPTRRSPINIGARPVPLADRLAPHLRAVADFPRPGIVFRDITPLLGDPELFAEAVDAMAAAAGKRRVDAVVGIESRGFVLGGAIAYALGAGFVPVRKAGRLPYATESVEYTLEYGEAILEVHADAITAGQTVMVVDDLLATGGTASATIELVERLRGSIVCLAFLVELTELGGAAALRGHPHLSLLTI
jgi:adenine phosphoribosyltransferase